LRGAAARSVAMARGATPSSAAAHNQRKKGKDRSRERPENWRSRRELRSSKAAVESRPRRACPSARQVHPIAAGSDRTSLMDPGEVKPTQRRRRATPPKQDPRRGLRDSMWVGAQGPRRVFAWKAGKPGAEANGGRVQSTRRSASKPPQKEAGRPVPCGTKAGNSRWSEGVPGSRAALQTPRQKAAPSVSAEPNKQGAEICVRGAWTEAAEWTTEAAEWTRPRLMGSPVHQPPRVPSASSALERGMEGGRW